MWKRRATPASTALVLLAAGLLTIAIASALVVAGPRASGDQAQASTLGQLSAGPPPKAWTTRAETWEIGSASLNGVINPRGAPTSYYFQYGSTNSYGRIAKGIRGTYDGDENYAVAASVFELRPGATYHFRVVAVNGGGKAYGADEAFTTIKSRPDPGTVIACYHEKVSRYTALAHPSRCILRGQRGKQTVGIPIKGMRWGHWGVFATRAAFGVDMRDGERVRVVAFRPITCDDGRTWYSRVGGVFLRHVRGFEFRLPTCDGP